MINRTVYASKPIVLLHSWKQFEGSPKSASSLLCLWLDEVREGNIFRVPRSCSTGLLSLATSCFLNSSMNIGQFSNVPLEGPKVQGLPKHCALYSFLYTNLSLRYSLRHRNTFQLFYIYSIITLSSALSVADTLNNIKTKSYVSISTIIRIYFNIFFNSCIFCVLRLSVKTHHLKFP